jgi:uncharacterized coiled-coil DUF342 family protein
MYNVFRLNGRYNEAAYLRELFDEPATLLYQISALIRTVDEAALPGSEISQEMIVGQLDELILSTIQALEGEKETEIVKRLLNLRSLLSHPDNLAERDEQVKAAQEEVMQVVNDFFYQRLMIMPGIKAYILKLQQED